MSDNLFEDKVEYTSPDSETKELHFYYNREERLKKAPQNVRDYYNGGMRPPKGFKVLFSKQNRFIFLALVLFVGSVWVYSGFNKTRSFAGIKDINFELNAFAYEEEIYTSIQVKRNSKSKSTEPYKIDATVFLIEPNNQVFDKQELSLVYDSGEKYLRTKCTDYDIIRVDAIVSINGEERELSSEVKR